MHSVTILASSTYVWVMTSSHKISYTIPWMKCVTADSQKSLPSAETRVGFHVKCLLLLYDFNQN
jgi:hypothetical protein